MSKVEFMEYAQKRIEKKRKDKEIGEKEARNFVIETHYKINKRLQHERSRRNYRW